MTVRQLLASIDSRELQEWAEYYALEPFGTPADDVCSAQIAHLIYSANRGKNAPRLKLTDFLMFPEGKPRQGKTPDQMLAVMQMVAAAQNAPK